MTRSGAVRTLVLLAGLAVLSVGLQPAAASAASAGASSSRWTRHGPEGGFAAAIVVSLPSPARSTPWGLARYSGVPTEVASGATVPRHRA